MPRIFVAARLGDAVERAAAACERRLAERLRDVKWVEPKNLHLTLRFFGELDAERADAAGEVVQAVAEVSPPVSLTLEGVGTFPARGSPRVVWVGLTDGAQAMVELAARLDRAFGDAGLGREERPFRPHLTLGRWRQARGHRQDDPCEAREAIASATFGATQAVVRDLRVIASELRPDGPRYTDRLVAALGGAKAP